MKVSIVLPFILTLLTFILPACNASRTKPPTAHKITVTTVQSKAITLSQQYVCQIESHHHINIRAPEVGYLDAINVKAGQPVKEGDVLFQVNHKKLFEDEVISRGDVLPLDSKRQKARTTVEPAAVVLGSAEVKAPFDGIVGRLALQQGSLVQKGETLTTLSDNSLIWAYFNLSEARYLEFKAAKLDQHLDDLKIELVLANGNKFNHLGKLNSIHAEFNSTTGSIRFRADFPNPDHLLRRGQAGRVVVSRLRADAIVVPQRATFEVQRIHYVYVVDKDGKAHRHQIDINNEFEDFFVIKSGVTAGDRIVLDGGLKVREGEKVE